MENSQKKKVIVVLGPTASGKSGFAVKLAKKFKGEVVSADSRQVYKDMNIGTGKITEKEKSGIPHHLLDVASPKSRFTVVQYQKKALETIKNIFKKEKVPIICGGTGFYLQSVIDGMVIPEVKPDWKLRKRLEKLNKENLFELLKKLDPKRAKTIDKNNPRRLIRAIEITKKTKKPVPRIKFQPPPYIFLLLGIKKDKEELKKLIQKRLLKRMGQGMTAEVRELRKKGVSWRKLNDFGLEYRYLANFLQGKINKKEMLEKLQKAIEDYSRRQMVWFKKDKRIIWIKNYKEAEKIVLRFLKK